MAETHCFTSATFAYLDRVRVLGETLRRHHPDWSLSLCLPDKPPPGFNLDFAGEVFDQVVGIEDLDIPRAPAWIFEHGVVELCTAVKGAMLCRLLDAGAEKIIYLDPDIALFGSLQPVVDLLDTHDIILTPHRLMPETETIPIIDYEIGALKHGIYNLGFLAVAGRGEGQRFARWWRDRLRDFCFDDIPNGLFTDQRWCDHVPGLFDRVHVLRDPGYNVASWNLGQRPLAITADGSLLAAGCPLRFFHFTKVPGIGEAMIEAYAGGRIEVFELLAWYRGRLAAHVVAGLPPGWWAYGHYDDGSPIAREHRIAYRRQDKHDRATDPFAGGAAVFETG
jgi:hypothetical protein